MDHKDIRYTQACPLIGLPTPEGILNGVPIFPVVLDAGEQDLADKLWAAIDKPGDDPAVIILRDALGIGSPEWAALVELKKEITQRSRGRYYQEKVLGLIVDFFFKHCTVEQINGHNVLVVDIATMNEIKGLQSTIEANVPY